MPKMLDHVTEMVAEALTADPDLDLKALYERCKKAEPKIGEISLRQFNARYPLQVKRRAVQKEKYGPPADSPRNNGQPELRLIPRGKLVPWPELNSRELFPPDELAELAASIREQGLLEPLLVTEAHEPADGESHWIVAGERRYRASEIAELGELPCIVREIDHPTATALVLIENLQRSDLTPIEEARGIRRYMDAHPGVTQAQVGERLGGFSQGWVSNRLRLLELPAVLTALVQEGVVNASGARDHLLEFTDADDDVLEQIDHTLRSAAGKHGAPLRDNDVWALLQRLSSKDGPEDEPAPKPKPPEGRGSERVSFPQEEAEEAPAQEEAAATEGSSLKEFADAEADAEEAAIAQEQTEAFREELRKEYERRRMARGGADTMAVEDRVLDEEDLVALFSGGNSTPLLVLRVLEDLGSVPRGLSPYDSAGMRAALGALDRAQMFRVAKIAALRIRRNGGEAPRNDPLYDEVRKELLARDADQEEPEEEAPEPEPEEEPEEPTPAPKPLKRGDRIKSREDGLMGYVLSIEGSRVNIAFEEGGELAAWCSKEVVGWNDDDGHRWVHHFEPIKGFEGLLEEAREAAGEGS